MLLLAGETTREDGVKAEALGMLESHAKKKLTARGVGFIMI